MQTPTTPTQCPQCKGDQFTAETVDRLRCSRCSWRLKVKPDGMTTDWLNWTTAGQKAKQTPRRAGRSCHAYRTMTGRRSARRGLSH